MIIEFGNIDYKIIIPFIYPVIYHLRRLIHKDEEKEIFEIFMIFFGYLFSGIIYLLIKYRMNALKNKNNLEELEEEIKNDIEKEPKGEELKEIQLKIVRTIAFGQNQLDVERKKINKIKFRKKYLFILSLVLIYLFPLLLDSYISIIFGDHSIKTSSSISLFICVISYIFLSRLILGEKIYMHQIFSSIIIFISILMHIFSPNINLLKKI